MDKYNFLGFDIPIDLINMTGGGVSTFDEIAFGHYEYLKKTIDIQPTDKFLEIGCGIGRDAIPLTGFITTGSYDGIDIIGRSIEWCKANIESKFDFFKFHHFDVKDKLHNPYGQRNLQDYKIPCEDSSIDKIFLWSVFTHMFENDILYYLKEFNRVLKPTGQILISCFIVDDEILKKAREIDLTPYSLRFEYKYGDSCFINNLEFPTGAVAFTKEKFQSFFKAAGFISDLTLLEGQWWGNPNGQGYGQDIVVLNK